MKFSLIGNSCITQAIYQLYNPSIDKHFIEYNNPFISSFFSDDESFVRLCENYDYYISLEPVFGEPINNGWFKDTG